MRRFRDALILILLILVVIVAGCKPVSKVNIEKHTNGVDADVPPGPDIFVGDEVTWTYTVTNTGKTELSGVVVTDNMGVEPEYVSGDVNADGKLQVSETWIYEASGTAESSLYSNIGTVVANYNGTEVSDTDPSHYTGKQRRPDISIQKKTNGSDANTEPGPYIVIGAEVTWTYKVENTGDLDLTDIEVTDDKGVVPVKIAGDTTDDILSPGEVWIYEAKGVATAGQYSNIGEAEGYVGVIKVSDTDPSHYFGAEPPGILLEKLVNGEDADAPTGPSIPEGEEVVWTYNVENTGGVGLTDVAVDDDDSSLSPAYTSGDDGDSVLEPGETWVFEATGTAALGQYSNLGTAEAVYAEDDTLVSDTDPSHYFGVPAIALDIEKHTNGEDADTVETSCEVVAGDEVTWTYYVENTGGSDLVDVLVNDDMGETPAYQSGDDGDGVLEPGEIWVYEATGTAVAGQYSNTGYAEGWFGDYKASDTDLSHYYGGNAPILTTWEYDFMVPGNGDKIGDEGWLIDGGFIGEYLPQYGVLLNQTTIAAPYFFTGDFTFEFTFLPKVRDEVEIFRMALRLWNNQYSTSSARRYVDFAMYYFNVPTHDDAYYQVNQGNGSYVSNEYSGNAPGLRANDDNTCVIEREGNEVSIYLNGTHVRTINILAANLASGYCPMVHGHGSWDTAESNFYIRKVKVTYKSGEMFYDSW